jgi:hypothetical protein
MQFRIELAEIDTVLAQHPAVRALAGVVLVSRAVDRIAPHTRAHRGRADRPRLDRLHPTRPPTTRRAAGRLAHGARPRDLHGRRSGHEDRLQLTRRAAVPLASSALNLLNTIGGSVGTAVLAVILQSRLAARGDVDLAFADAFWWALGLCAVAALGITRLPCRRPAEVRGNP